MIFDTRYSAWEHLSILLKNKIQDFSDTIILWILNGWAQVTQKVAENIQKPTTFLVVKWILYQTTKIWAVSQDGLTVYNKAIIGKLGIDPAQVKQLENEFFNKAKIESEKFDLHFKDFTSKQVIIVDDWVVSGLTAAVAAKYAKQNGASRIILAVPVINSRVVGPLKNLYDEIIFAESIEDRNFWLSKFYLSYYSLSTEDVYEIIHKIKEKWLFLNH
jgi:putative phosphoribosyl transferase